MNCSCHKFILFLFLVYFLFLNLISSYSQQAELTEQAELADQAKACDEKLKNSGLTDKCREPHTTGPCILKPSEVSGFDGKDEIKCQTEQYYCNSNVDGTPKNDVTDPTAEAKVQKCVDESNTACDNFYQYVKENFQSAPCNVDNHDNQPCSHEKGQVRDLKSVDDRCKNAIAVTTHYWQIFNYLPKFWCKRFYTAKPKVEVVRWSEWKNP